MRILVGFVYKINGKLGSLLGVSVSLLLFEIGNTHVGITNSFNL